jgi:hypothetical protein
MPTLEDSPTYLPLGDVRRRLWKVIPSNGLITTVDELVRIGKIDDVLVASRIVRLHNQELAKENNPVDR